MIRHALLSPMTELESFNRVAEALRVAAPRTLLCTGAVDSQKPHMAWALAEHLNRPLAIITYSELRAREIMEDMSFFRGDGARIYPAADGMAAYADAGGGAGAAARLEALCLLASGETPALAISAEALTHTLTPPKVFAGHVFELAVGGNVDITELAGRLIRIGYERADRIERPGHFAMRGGIVDIYPAAWDSPARVEFWGDEVDSIRVLDPHSQRSADKLQNLRICPARELIYDDAARRCALERLNAAVGEYRRDYASRGLEEEGAALRDAWAPVLDALAGNRHHPGLTELAGYFYERPACLLDYLPENTLLFFDEPSRIAQHCDDLAEEYNSRLHNRVLKGRALPGVGAAFSYARVLGLSSRFGRVLMSSLSHTVRDMRVDEQVSLQVKSSGVAQKSVDALENDLRYHVSKNARVLLMAGGRTRAARLTAELHERGLPMQPLKDMSLEGQELERGRVAVCEGSLLRGFEYTLAGLCVISGRELFEQARGKTRRRRKKAAQIDHFTDLRVGDYVVHDSHGIGVYQGIERIKADGVSMDYLKISYADGGNLYIPTNDLDMIQKYIGGEDASPRLNKLGGGEWSRAKARVRKAVSEIAKDLVELYARREASTGHAYSVDTVWQAEFEESFPFEETEDQLAAIEDVKRDMESARVMDRLICGDVGYGKTEIALRAAFKAAMEGKQVACLVPTTILAQQHYNTFTQRMRDFPVNTGLMSRFRTQKQQQQTAADITSGKADIVIGTHRLLSKDIAFKNLGLVIVDEEQRFGVTHKERLKKLRENVDVLTLTATPIPRTLHMSLTGIRDMSVLEEPPEERTPVETYVMEYNPGVVREAVMREMARDGQVYYLYNRVRSIADVAAKLKALVPEAVICHAHGQMSERELEDIMMDFINGEIDVLVCTTIIESGLDIPNVNTIIIQDADTMGLSQLYQLRGRVGRSNRSSYAYLMYRRDKSLTETSEKRLQTIREFTEFGAGFKIAMRDMEIRGAGNLLGEAQHGHMDAVGYDMYCKLLKEAVDGLRGRSPEDSFETTVSVILNAFIPEFYIEDEQQKLEMYKKIALIQNESDYNDVYEELEDRFGDLPVSVVNLLSVARMKAAAHSIGVTSLEQKGAAVVITFRQNASVDPGHLRNAIRQRYGRLLFTAAPAPYLTYKPESEDGATVVAELEALIKSLPA